MQFIPIARSVILQWCLGLRIDRFLLSLLQLKMISDRTAGLNILFFFVVSSRDSYLLLENVYTCFLCLKCNMVSNMVQYVVQKHASLKLAAHLHSPKTANVINPNFLTTSPQVQETSSPVIKQYFKHSAMLLNST